MRNGVSLRYTDQQMLSIGQASVEIVAGMAINPVQKISIGACAGQATVCKTDWSRKNDG
jgi:hypothetical protein